MDEHAFELEASVLQAEMIPETEVNASPEKEQEQATPSFDVVLFCHPRNIHNLVQSLEEEIKHAAGTLPLFILWSGVSAVLHQGVIVLESEGEIPSSFFHNLSIDYEIFDYVVYSWIQKEDPQEQDHEEKHEASQCLQNSWVEGREFV